MLEGFAILRSATLNNNSFGAKADAVGLTQLPRPIALNMKHFTLYHIKYNDAMTAAVMEVATRPY